MRYSPRFVVETLRLYWLKYRITINYYTSDGNSLDTFCLFRFWPVFLYERKFIWSLPYFSGAPLTKAANVIVCCPKQIYFVWSAYTCERHISFSTRQAAIVKASRVISLLLTQSAFGFPFYLTYRIIKTFHFLSKKKKKTVEFLNERFCFMCMLSRFFTIFFTLYSTMMYCPAHGIAYYVTLPLHFPSHTYPIFLYKLTSR